MQVWKRSAKKLPVRYYFNSTMPKQYRLKTVTSGIGLDELGSPRAATASQHRGFITSRFARVLLAGAGFLADAVSATDQQQ